MRAGFHSAGIAGEARLPGEMFRVAVCSGRRGVLELLGTLLMPDAHAVVQRRGVVRARRCAVLAGGGSGGQATSMRTAAVDDDECSG